MQKIIFLSFLAFWTVVLVKDFLWPQSQKYLLSKIGCKDSKDFYGHLELWCLKELAHFQIDYYMCPLKATLGMTQKNK